jgi:hypothetical protein
MAAASSSQRRRPVSADFRVAQAASSTSSTSKVSMVLLRAVVTLTGVRANTSPARRPAPVPNARRTRWYSTPTEATPASASGKRMLSPENPSTLALAT